MAPGLAQHLLQQYALRGRAERLSPKRATRYVQTVSLVLWNRFRTKIRQHARDVVRLAEVDPFAQALAEGGALKSDRMNTVSLLHNASTSGKDVSLLWISVSVSVPDVIFTFNAYAC